MYPLVETGSHLGINNGSAAISVETAGLRLIAVCSEGDAIFTRPNVANAAQLMGVEFHRHNEEVHGGAAHLKTPYPVHGG